MITSLLKEVQYGRTIGKHGCTSFFRAESEAYEDAQFYGRG